MAEWFSVKEKLPEPYVDVLTYRAKNGYFEVAHRLKSRWWCESRRNHVTHWMPLPEPPENENKGWYSDGGMDQR